MFSCFEQLAIKLGNFFNSFLAIFDKYLAKIGRDWINFLKQILLDLKSRMILRRQKTRILQRPVLGAYLSTRNLHKHHATGGTLVLLQTFSP